MDLVLQTNIFFYITSAAVVVVTVLVCVVLYYVARILRDVREVTDRVKRGTEHLADDLENLRRDIKQDGMHLRDIAMYFVRRAGIIPGAKSTRTRRPRKEADAEVEGEE
jgi:hypothetical protein